MVSTRRWPLWAGGARWLLWSLLLLSGATVQAQPAPPPNDDFDSATVIGSLPFTDMVDTRGATAAPDDPEGFGGLSTTVWYKTTPTENVAISLSTKGSSYQAAICVFTGTRGSLTPVGAVNCSFTGSRLVFDAEAGVTYFILVGSVFGGPGGDLVFTAVEPAPPPNDDIEDAIVVDALPFTSTVDTASATTDLSPPDPAGCFGNRHTVWYAFTPTTDGRFTIRATGPATVYAISVYTGTPGNLSQVACADQAELSFDAEAGVTHFIMLAAQEGFAGGELDFLLFQTLDLGFSLDRQGAVSGVTGVATVSGTVTCSVPVLINGTPGVCVCGTLRQSRRFTITEAETCVCGDCVGELPFTLTFSDPDTPFLPGRAFIDVEATGCTEFNCDTEHISREIHLRGGGR